MTDKNEKSEKSEKYILFDLIILKNEDKITAFQYVYFNKENVIREITYPAEIDKSSQTLIIKKYIMKGKDTEYSINDYISLFSNLPRWKKTRYILFDSNNRSEKYLCSSSLLIKYSRNK